MSTAGNPTITSTPTPGNPPTGSGSIPPLKHTADSSVVWFTNGLYFILIIAVGVAYVCACLFYLYNLTEDRVKHLKELFANLPILMHLFFVMSLGILKFAFDVEFAPLFGFLAPRITN